jgi:excisionase family DNA binding protein
MKLVKPKKKGRPKKSEKLDPITDLLDVNQVATMLKMSASHVYTLTSTKKIPHIKVLGRKVLFDKNEIMEWLKSKKVSVK